MSDVFLTSRGASSGLDWLVVSQSFEKDIMVTVRKKTFRSVNPGDFSVTDAQYRVAPGQSVYVGNDDNYGLPRDEFTITQADYLN